MTGQPSGWRGQILFRGAGPPRPPPTGAGADRINGLGYLKFMATLNIDTI